MRLLSFLSDIEHALTSEHPAGTADAWQATRIVNYSEGVARLTLSPQDAHRTPVRSRSVFLQAFTLADGSVCVKASLSWSGSEASSLFAVYATPELDWKHHAAEIASALLAGPAPGQLAGALSFAEPLASTG